MNQKLSWKKTGCPDRIGCQNSHKYFSNGINTHPGSGRPQATSHSQRELLTGVAASMAT
ncbi:MAG: hypothetical protein K9K37_09920 [Desulfocapsa sp.]|nr:hypothetical protein [Desulfocapsa sp.]